MKYPGHESIVLEFKQTLPTKQEILKTIIGFCNLYGGRLIIGVADNGDIVGLPEDEIDQLIEGIQQSIHSSSTPHIIPFIHAQRLDNKLLLVIEVSEGMNKPYFQTAKGIDEGVFLRMGRQTMRASKEMIQELKWRSTGKSPDEKPLYHASVNDLNLQSVEKFLSSRIQQPEKPNSLSLEELMLHYKILVKEYQKTFPSIAGMLLFGKRPQDFLSEAFIIGSHFKGVSGREAIATRDFTGALFDQYTECVHFITSRLNRQFTITGSQKRSERLELPEVGLREVILNAVIHRDYYLSGPIKIALFDDRIEVFSPGTFPGPLNSTNLEMGLTYIRNFVICRIFREAGFIEKLGTGFLTLFKSWREEELPEPIVSEGPGFIKCILPRRSSSLPPSGDQTKHLSPEEQVLRLLLTYGEIKANDVARLLTVSRATASRLLSALVVKKRIVRLGQAGATKYVLES